LKEMAGDNKEETEALLGELDDKMKEVDKLA
jgi:predicted DNA-binding ribbon-helix-helix protein